MNKKNCCACGNYINFNDYNDYYLCPHCNTYNYISNNSDIDDNNEYFNKIFKDNPLDISKVKQKIFTLFRFKNKILNCNKYKKYSTLRKDIENQLYFGDKNILEIGFGNGDRLINLLKLHKSAYGIDVSKQAVENFQITHPEYKNRVQCKSIDKLGNSTKYHVIYCNALFEHIDNPDFFLDSISGALENEGYLIFDSLPILTTEKSNFTYKEDISFWKPCHRVIYSIRGLEKILHKKEYKIEKIALLDDYNYRVLSLYKKIGITEIEYFRNPVIRNKKLKGIFKFLYLLIKALYCKSLVLNTIVLIKKKY